MASASRLSKRAIARRGIAANTRRIYRLLDEAWDMIDGEPAEARKRLESASMRLTECARLQRLHDSYAVGEYRKRKGERNEHIA